MNKKSVTTLTLKQINKHTVYQYIYRQRETSKFQIVQDLNMGLSTVSQNLTTLEKEGLIERNGYFASTGGRKAQIIRIVPDLKIAIGIGILKSIAFISLRWICTVRPSRWRRFHLPTKTRRNITTHLPARYFILSKKSVSGGKNLRNFYRHTGNHFPGWFVRDLRCYHGKYTDAAF